MFRIIVKIVITYLQYMLPVCIIATETYSVFTRLFNVVKIINLKLNLNSFINNRVKTLNCLRKFNIIVDFFVFIVIVCALLTRKQKTHCTKFLFSHAHYNRIFIFIMCVRHTIRWRNE